MKKILISISILLLAGGCSGNKEGIVRTTDCRESIEVKPDSWDATIHSYTCNYYREKEKIVSGTCARVELNKNGDCIKEFWYSVENQITETSREINKNNQDNLPPLDSFNFTGQ